MRTTLKSLEPQILGKPGRDNSLFVKVNAGQSIYRALFDCGADCLNALSPTEVQKIDAIFFSHLHMDHVAGFDHFLRMNFNRTHPIYVFGPPRTAEILHHRLQGVLWDRTEGSTGKICISEIHGESLSSYLTRSCDGFSSIEPLGQKPINKHFLETPEIAVQAVSLDHGSPSIGYLLSTKSSPTVNVARLADMGLRTGPWMRALRDETLSPDVEINTGEKLVNLGELRENLLISKPVERVGYLTDFRLDVEGLSALSNIFSECDILVCENNYRDEHAELARKNYHITSADVANLATVLNPKHLVLFHLSDRYDRGEWVIQLSEVRNRFLTSYLPEEWRTDLSGHLNKSSPNTVGNRALSETEQATLSSLREEGGDQIFVQGCTNNLLQALASDGHFSGVKTVDLTFDPTDHVNLELLHNFNLLEDLVLCEVGQAYGGLSAPRLAKLRSLEIYDWRNLPNLSFLLGSSSPIEHLVIYSCPTLASLAGVQELTNLKNLQIFNCPELRDVEDLGRLGHLESLWIAKTPQLSSLATLGGVQSLVELRVSRDTPALSHELALLRKSLPKCVITLQ